MNLTQNEILEEYLYKGKCKELLEENELMDELISTLTASLINFNDKKDKAKNESKIHVRFIKKIIDYINITKGSKKSFKRIKLLLIIIYKLLTNENKRFKKDEIIVLFIVYNRKYLMIWVLLKQYCH